MTIPQNRHAVCEPVYPPSTRTPFGAWVSAARQQGCGFEGKGAVTTLSGPPWGPLPPTGGPLSPSGPVVPKGVPSMHSARLPGTRGEWESRAPTPAGPEPWGGWLIPTPVLLQEAGEGGWMPWSPSALVTSAVTLSPTLQFQGRPGFQGGAGFYLWTGNQQRLGASCHHPQPRLSLVLCSDVCAPPRCPSVRNDSCCHSFSGSHLGL